MARMPSCRTNGPRAQGPRILAGPANSTIEITKGKDWPEGAGDKGSDSEVK